MKKVKKKLTIKKEAVSDLNTASIGVNGGEGTVGGNAPSDRAGQSGCGPCAP